MKKLVFLLFLFFLMQACSPRLRKSYAKLSPPEKSWVVFHPFKASNAYTISQEAENIKDSIAKHDIIGNDNNGGHLDAFKHSYWMARLTQDIGKRAALSLGEAHEKGNYKSFKKRKLEDGLLPDKPSSDMDLYNNIIGINIGIKNKITSKKVLIQKVLNSLQHGRLMILSKDSLGNFLDCQQRIIIIDSLKHRWDTKKCLVPSNKTPF